MELTPREVDPTASRRRRSPLAYGVLAVVLLGLGVVVWKGLSSASLYFHNADEAVEQRLDLGDKRFRLQGTVLGDDYDTTADGVHFTVAYNGVSVRVQHEGDPPNLFEIGIPVVLEGRWEGSGPACFFDSDRILVKHSEEYEAENDDRLDDAEAKGEADPAAGDEVESGPAEITACPT
ncbi:MAG: cytochrome c maturation protein CcmE [Actinomycetota bacterium]|nr:cytochrome c maturation protein CcmE [Actinomycetota bacterium]